MIVLLSLYELFQNIIAYWVYTASRSPLSELKSIEVKLLRENKRLTALVNMFLFIARINEIVFLVFLGMRTTWSYPIILWLIVFVSVNIIQGVLRKYIGQRITALLGFAVLPIAGVWMWFKL